MKYIPRIYQKHGFTHLLDHPKAALFMEMGLGKTVITLSALNYFHYADLELNKTLVIGPKKVVESVWTDEINEWDHLRHMKASVVLGSVSERIAALNVKADIYLINRENVAWLVAFYQTGWPFDCVVIDESSSFKSQKSQRFRSLKMVMPIAKRAILLTGTPVPNGPVDLWSQMYLLDQGERLCKTEGAFKDTFLRPVLRKGEPSHFSKKWRAAPEDVKRIHAKIGDIVISMKRKDWLSLPPRMEHLRKVKLSKALMAAYEAFEETQVLEYLEHRNEDGEPITAINGAALTNKLLQFTAGFVYDDNKNPIHVHDEKIEALGELLEEAGREPVMIFYWFQESLAKIKKAYGGQGLDTKEDIARWNRGEIKRLIVSPGSAAHGLNLQKTPVKRGHTIIWYDRTWSSEMWDQGNDRIDRGGRIKPLNIYSMPCPATIDMDQIRAVELKRKGQSALMDAVKARIEKYAPRKAKLLKYGK